MDVRVCCIYSETELLCITLSPQRALFNSDCSSNIIPESSAMMLFVGRGGGRVGSSLMP